MVSTLLRDPQALSSTLASLGGCYSLGPSGLLKCVETLDSVSNYYLIVFNWHNYSRK